MDGSTLFVRAEQVFASYGERQRGHEKSKTRGVQERRKPWPRQGCTGDVPALSASVSIPRPLSVDAPVAPEMLLACGE